MSLLTVAGLVAVSSQFIEYAFKVCHFVKAFCEDDHDEFYEGVFAESASHLNNFTNRFNNQRNLKLSLGQAQFHEARLTELVERFDTISTKLSHTLLRIATDDVVKNNNAYLSHRARAVRECWNQLEIDRLLARLDSSQKLLVKEVVACMSTCLSGEEPSDRSMFSNDYGSCGKIIEILAVAEDIYTSYKHELRKKRPEAVPTLVFEKDQSGAQLKTAIAAIVTFQNGDIEYFTEQGVSAHDLRGRQHIYYSLRDTDVVVAINNFERIQDLVLDSLHFPQCHARLNTVKFAHQKTYEWIFCPPESDKPWAPFIDWLESGSGCYYISGKPGSGKSTLMKFTVPHERTRTALEKWAGGDLVRASFFFWNLGSPLQKSSVGLLRGLLHDLLKQKRGLIPVVMPEICRKAIQSTNDSGLGEASEEDLKRWIRKLFAKSTTSFKFFLVVDGLDEFEGDYDNLVQLITDVIKNKNVKILLSSRPTDLSEDSFRGYPHLRLHDLTKGDIAKYANDHLTGRLAQKSGPEWTELISEITNRSQGVFLWVVLVVQSLTDGLREGDNIKEMGDRLNALPNDLKKLYDHIFKKFKIRYPRQASEMFQLLLLAQQVQSAAGYPLLIQLSFCDEAPEHIVSTPVRSLDGGTYLDNCEQMGNRIRSRSGGLIESREWQTNRISGVNQTVVTSMYVDFIHRTVVEFLRLPGVWDDLLASTATPRKYDPSPPLFRSCVMMCKTLPMSRGIDTEISVLWHMMDRGLIYASMAEDSGKPVAPEQLKQLDSSLQKHWSNSMKCFSQKGFCDTQGHWARGYSVDPQRQHVLDPENFASVALFHGLEHYLVTELTDPAAVAAMNPTQLLFNSLRYIGPPPWEVQDVEFDGSLTNEAALFQTRKDSIRPRWVRIAICLLEVKDTDPNKQISGSTSAWELMLSYVTMLVKTQRVKQSFHRNLRPDDFGSLFAKLLDAFIQQGADLYFSKQIGAEPAWKLVLQLFSVAAGSSAHIKPWASQPAVQTNASLTAMRDYFQLLIDERLSQSPLDLPLRAG